MIRALTALKLWCLVTALGMPLSAFAQSVVIEGVGRFDDLAEALVAARTGDVLLIEGTHRGNFTIDRSLILRGGNGAVLDGGGAGTVVVIAADDVRIEGLAVTRSGLSHDYWQAWGPAGIRVEADRAVLAEVDVSGNGWGILFRDGQGSVLRDSLIADNQRDGVLVMGGDGHLLQANTVIRNRTGVLVDAFYGENDRVLVPLIHDPAWTQQMAALQAAASPALRHVIADNEVRGNAASGIRLQFHTRESRVVRNRVFATGFEREPDAAEHAFWEAELRTTIFSPVEAAGSGIVIYCWPEENEVADNEVFDNRALGIHVTLAIRNRIARNQVHGNAIGIEIAGAEENTFLANTVHDNKDYGIRAGGWMWMGQGRPDRNLIHLNALSGNGVNAFDGSDRILSAQEIADHIALMPWPTQMRMIYDNAAMRLQMAQMMVGRQQAGHNRWDDSELGNHHDDFDEPQEGFVDRDGDGIGEVGRAIPGGGAVDRFPLTAEALARAWAALDG